jgi:hypothetical protein
VLAFARAGSTDVDDLIVASEETVSVDEPNIADEVDKFSEVDVTLARLGAVANLAGEDECFVRPPKPVRWLRFDGERRVASRLNLDTAKLL